jgi:transcriptional regulator NrdR family protein
MICPKCNSKVTTVEVRQNNEDNETYRQKKCNECGHIFYTIEFEVEFDESYKNTWRDHCRDHLRRKRKKGMK